jgi:hypothetical protein
MFAIRAIVDRAKFSQRAIADKEGLAIDLIVEYLVAAHLRKRIHVYLLADGDGQ